MIQVILVFLWSMSGCAWAGEPRAITFPSGKLTLSGFLYKPEGNGPFPAVLYNHGSEPKPGSKPEPGKFFSNHGYVFFVPHRRSHGRSPSDRSVDSLIAQGLRGVVALHEVHLEDQLAALDYLNGLSYVIPHKISVAGCSYGGIQTILAVEANAEKKLGLRAAIDFAGGAITWAKASDLRSRMLRAVGKATIPVLFVQAENDYDLAPSRVLAKELDRLGKPNRMLIFPPYGQTAAEGHGGFCSQGVDVWGTDVLSFLAQNLEK